MGLFQAINRYQIEQNKRNIEDNRSRLHYQDSNAQKSTNRLDQVALAAAAMWELMKDRYGYIDEDLTRKMNEIDLRDGNPDGVARAKVLACTGCGRPINERIEKCIHCSTPNAYYSPFKK